MTIDQIALIVGRTTLELQSRIMVLEQEIERLTAEAAPKEKDDALKHGPTNPSPSKE